MSFQIPSGGQYPRLAASLGRVVRTDGQHRWLTGAAPTGAGTAQSATITVSGADNSATYSVRLLDATPYGSGVNEVISYTTDGSATDAELAAGLEAAFGAVPSLGLFVLPVSRSSLVLTVTAISGRSFTLSEVADPGNDLAIANTAAAAGPTFHFGHAAVLGAPATGSPVGNITPAVTLPVITSARSTLVFDLVTNNNSQSVSLPVIHTPFGGQPSNVPLTFTTGASAALTIAALVAAATSRFPTANVAITTADDVVTITFPAGDSIGVGTITDGTADFTVTTTQGVLPSLCLVRDAGNVPGYDAFPGPNIVTSYPIGSGVPVAAQANGGTVYAAAIAAVTPAFGDQVYVDTASSPAGKLTNAASLTTIPWVGVRFQGVDPNNSAIAHIAL
jgi:hypothetical protein